jgi:uncharacterized membrane protein HdeD (DUF308 family)
MSCAKTKEETMNIPNEANSGRGCLMGLGVLCVLAGLVAMGSPFLTGALVTTIIGVSLILGGILELMMASGVGGWKAGPSAFLGGALAILAGGILIAHPVLGAAVVGMFLIAFFLLDGVSRSVLAVQLKPMPGWGWQLFSGIISILLGILLWQGWPLSGMWAIGILIGIRLLFAGFGMLFLVGASAAVGKAIE